MALKRAARKTWFLSLSSPAFISEFFHFRWNSTFCLTSREVLHFTHVLRSTSVVLNPSPKTTYGVKTFFSQCLIILWNVQNLVKHSTWYLNDFSALLAPFRKHWCSKSVPCPRKAQERAGSLWWTPNTRVWVFNWQASEKWTYYLYQNCLTPLLAVIALLLFFTVKWKMFS